MSPRTYRGYRRLGPFARALWDSFDRVLVQTRVDYERLRQVGVPPSRESAATAKPWAVATER